jgi:hypothetical protein
MNGSWLLFLGIIAVFGVPLFAVGVVLFLCEWSWKKSIGSMGSQWLIMCGCLLCLPLLYFGSVFWDRVLP